MSQPNPPQLLPTAVLDGHAPGLTYRIQGELVPVLHVWLDGSVPVIFEHHVVLWKDPGLDIGIHQMKGAFKRIIAGMPIFLTEARGPGEVAFSRDGAGHVFPIHLQPGMAIEVREHQYLAAPGNLDYGSSRQPRMRAWSGFMAMAKFSRKSWDRGSRLVSNRLAGFTATKACAWTQWSM